MSFTQISFTFRSKLSELGIKRYKTFFAEKPVHSLKEYKTLIKSDYDSRPFLLSDYGQINSGLTNKDASFAIILIPDRYENWSKLNKIEYKIQKKRVFESIINRLEKAYPGIKEELEYSEIATPVTMKRYTGNPEGAIYGFAQNPLTAGLFRFPIKSPVSGLYFSGAWTYPGGGFTGVLWSGWACAHEILGHEPTR